jgi:hypothetical protein
MSRIHAGSLLVLSLVASLLSPTAESATEQREWRFTALLDGKVIGYQSFRLQEQGREKVLVSEARYNVKFLFMNVYTYTHSNKEVWRGDCLNRIDSRADDNGERFFVHGALERSHLALETIEGRSQLPECVMTFAYWNPRILDANRLLNAQTGQYLDIEVTPLGREFITAAGEEHPAQRYELKTTKFTIDLWYSPDQKWLGLETTTDSGSRLRYVLN